MRRSTPMYPRVPCMPHPDLPNLESTPATQASFRLDSLFLLFFPLPTESVIPSLVPPSHLTTVFTFISRIVLPLLLFSSPSARHTHPRAPLERSSGCLAGFWCIPETYTLDANTRVKRDSLPNRRPYARPPTHSASGISVDRRESQPGQSGAAALALLPAGRAYHLLDCGTVVAAYTTRTSLVARSRDFQHSEDFFSWWFLIFIVLVVRNPGSPRRIEEGHRKREDLHTAMGLLKRYYCVETIDGDTECFVENGFWYTEVWCFLPDGLAEREI